MSATRSGILNLPMLLTTAVCSILAGGIVSTFGQYMPFVYFSPVAMTVAGGLLTTLRVDSSSSQYLGYQALLGIGLGCGIVQGVVAVQAALPPRDVPSGTVMLMFMQTMGGAVFVSAAQSLFHNKLLEGITRNVPDVDAKKVIDAGATMLKDTVSKEALPGVLQAYNSAITYSFYIGVAFSGLAIFGALPMQWISVKKKA